MTGWIRFRIQWKKYRIRPGKKNHRTRILIPGILTKKYLFVLYLAVFQYWTSDAIGREIRPARIQVSHPPAAMRCNDPLGCSIKGTLLPWFASSNQIEKNDTLFRCIMSCPNMSRTESQARENKRSHFIRLSKLEAPNSYVICYDQMLFQATREAMQGGSSYVQKVVTQVI